MSTPADPRDRVRAEIGAIDRLLASFPEGGMRVERVALTAKRDELAVELLAESSDTTHHHPRPGTGSVRCTGAGGPGVERGSSAPDLSALVPSPHWEWRPGMRDVDGWLVWGVTRSGDLRVVSPGGATCVADLGDVEPDIDHGGTQGEMLALVRKAWGGRDIDISILSDGLTMISIQPHDDAFDEREVCIRGATLGLALAAALLAAPTP